MSCRTLNRRQALAEDGNLPVTTVVGGYQGVLVPIKLLDFCKDSLTEDRELI
jgi:hypothetical protein